MLQMAGRMGVLGTETAFEVLARANALAAQGRSIIVVSSEMQELIGICDRIMVMRSGRIVGAVTSEDMNESEIVVLATGVKSGEAA